MDCISKRQSVYLSSERQVIVMNCLYSSSERRYQVIVMDCISIQSDGLYISSSERRYQVIVMDCISKFRASLSGYCDGLYI